MAKTPKRSSTIVTIDQRSKSEQRKGKERRSSSAPVAVERRQQERRQKVSRRRQIDPTTCERDYTEPELEFMHALDKYKRTSGRMFPTCSEVLEVILGLGYRKVAASLDAATVPTDDSVGSISPGMPIADETGLLASN